MTSQLQREEDSGKRPEDWETKHQRHVITGFWVLLAVFIALMAVLMYAEGQGLFQSKGDHSAPASWPVGWE
jgi:hypothetical protein